MTLRARLIVAFLALSVLPLGVVTFYTYTTSVQAMRDVATREADLLAAVLNQRMQVITSQLSDRIEHLVDMTAAPQPAAPAVARAASPAAPAPASAAQNEQDQMNHRVADALGEAAVLLNTVNVQGSRGQYYGRGGGTGAGTNGPPRGGGQGANANAGGTPPTFRPQDGTRPPPPVTAADPTKPADATRPGEGLAAPRPPRPPATPLVSPAPSGTGTPGTPTPGVPDPKVVVATDDGMKIDLTQIRRDLYRQILPSTPPEQLTAEDRRRIAQEVNERMLGIVEGIKLSAAEIQKQAEEARKGADKQAQTAQRAAKRGVTPAPLAAPAPAAPPPAPAAPPPAAPMVPLKRTATFSGNQLNVRFERNGQVVQTVTADMNLPNMLMAVLQSTPREQGEVPFAVDKDGKIYTQNEADRPKVEAFGAAATPTGPLGKTVLADWIVVTTDGPAGTGLRFGIASPTGDSIAALRRTAGRNVGFGLLFIALALVGVVPLSSRLTRNLTTLTDGVARIARGDYRARVTVRSNDEMGALATAFNSMAADVEEHQRQAVEQERIKRELELGRQIQHDMQPQGALRLGLTEIKGVSVPAREVGGDFFNYFELATGQIAMLVGDVSGKGVGAALLMANIQASLRTRLALGQDLAAVADEIDRDIAQNAPETLYATLFVCTLDPATRMLRYVNCGHHPQFVLRPPPAGSSGPTTIERMASTGLPVGLLAGRGYREQEMPLQEGDRLFFYTDGCVETENEAGDFFGADRLEKALSGVGDAPDDVLAHVERAVEAFRGSRELLDDVTVMAVRVG